MPCDCDGEEIDHKSKKAVLQKKEKYKQESLIKEKRCLEINKERGAEGEWSISNRHIAKQSK